MRYPFNITQLFILVFLAQIPCLSQTRNIELPKKIRKIVFNGEIYRNATVSSDKTLQKLHYEIHGLHPNRCSIALKKLSQYEKFHEFIDLVKLSGYNSKKKHIYLYLDSKLMPFPMSLHFKIPRITKAGSYKFSFNKGFLKGLIGYIHVKQIKDGKCLFSATSKWQGKKSKIPDTVFEIFSETLGELVMKKLFRVSKEIN